jgi:hypothetical protein
MLNSEERTVVLGNLSDDEATSRTLAMELGVGGVDKAVIQFKDVTEFTTFTAKYTLKDGTDAIVQFFLPKELSDTELTGSTKDYWLDKFPRALDAIAREYFQADSPRLQAKYTEEVKSWWFRAQGYGDRIDFDGFVLGFLGKLDATLDTQ